MNCILLQVIFDSCHMAQMVEAKSKLESLIVQLHNRTNEAKEAFDEALAELNQEKTQIEKYYQTQFEKLKEEQRKWDEEKAKMEKIAASASPIVTLNVGGEKMSISRDTLTRAEGSLLATMFSGQWTDKLPKDSDGNIFLDYDPILFKFLLNQLRAWSNPSIKRVFRLPVGSEESFLELLRLLEFDERYIEVKTTTAGDTTKIIQVQQEVESFSTQNLVEVRLIDNNRRCEKVTRDSWQRVFGELDYVTGIHRIQFKLESGSANILIGVCSRNTPPTATPFYCQPTTHGWFNHGYVITNGYGFFPGWPQVNENDILELTINCEQRLLCIRNERSGAENSMQIDINRAPLPWCLLVLLFYQGSQVSLL